MQEEEKWELISNSGVHISATGSANVIHYIQMSTLDINSKRGPVSDNITSKEI